MDGRLAGQRLVIDDGRLRAQGQAGDRPQWEVKGAVDQIGRLRIEVEDQIRREQILEVDLQAVPLVHAQNNRPGPLILAQGDVAGGQDCAFGLGQARGLIDHVPSQSVDHAVGVEGAQAVVVEGLVQGDHIGYDRPDTARRGDGDGAFVNAGVGVGLFHGGRGRFLAGGGIDREVGRGQGGRRPGLGRVHR